MGADNDETTARLEARQRRYGPLVDALQALMRSQTVEFRAAVIRELSYLLDEPDE